MLGCGLSSVMVMSVHFVVGAVARSCRRTAPATLRSLLSNPIGPRAAGKGRQFSSRWLFRQRSATRFPELVASFPGTDAFAGRGVVGNHEDEDRHRRRRMNEPAE